MTTITKICLIEECDKISSLGRKGWCMKHWTRWHRYGNPLYVKYDRSIKDVTKLPEYKSWQGMKDRCYKTTNPAYPRYGARGIKMHNDWVNSFNKFYRYVGAKPSQEYSIDRIDNNGDYEPGNVRWATRQEQASNRRSNRYFTINGETKTLRQWSDFYGRKYKTVWARVNAGWSIEKALGL